LCFDYLDSVGLPSLYLARLDGTERQLLLAGGFGGDWSPDASKLAANEGGSIVTITLATRDVSPIAEGYQPAFSPGGAILAFSSFGPYSGPPDLWTVAADGGPASRVPLPGPPYPELRDADWSPDGTRLVATKAAENKVLFFTTLDGQDTSEIRVEGVDLHHPAWSPLGNRIAYVRSYGGLLGTYEVWLVSPDGTEHRRLVANGFHPQWFPEAGSLLISRAFGLELSLWTVDTLGQNLARLWSRP
jgi:Tol biopolymer transport system component